MYFYALREFSYAQVERRVVWHYIGMEKFDRKWWYATGKKHALHNTLVLSEFANRDGWGIMRRWVFLKNAQLPAAAVTAALVALAVFTWVPRVHSGNAVMFTIRLVSLLAAGIALAGFVIIRTKVTRVPFSVVCVPITDSGFLEETLGGLQTHFTEDPDLSERVRETVVNTALNCLKEGTPAKKNQQRVTSELMRMIRKEGFEEL